MRGAAIKSAPPILFVPTEVDEPAKIQKPTMQKFTLPGDSQLLLQVWMGQGTDEQFIMHTKDARDVCARKGFFADYKEALRKEAVFAVCLKNLCGIDTKILDVTDAAKTMKEIKLTNKSCAACKKKKLEAAESMFSLYESLLGPEAKLLWNSIVKQQVNCNDWKNLRGEIQPEARDKCPEAFEECVLTLHLLTVFSPNAAERQKLYLTHSLWKPGKLPIRVFFPRVQQLNSYLQHLPCLYDSSLATRTTKRICPFNDADLSCLLLQMCPVPWQDQYSVSKKYLPQDTRELLPILENIKKLDPGKPVTAKLSGNKKTGHQDRSGKRKREGHESCTPE